MSRNRLSTGVDVQRVYDCLWGIQSAHQYQEALPYGKLFVCLAYASAMQNCHAEWGRLFEQSNKGEGGITRAELEKAFYKAFCAPGTSSKAISKGIDEVYEYDKASSTQGRRYVFAGLEAVDGGSIDGFVALEYDNNINNSQEVQMAVKSLSGQEAFEAAARIRRKRRGVFGNLLTLFTGESEFYSEEGDIPYSISRDGVFSVTTAAQRKSKVAQRNVARYLENRKLQTKPR